MPNPIICDVCKKECWSDFGWAQHLVKEHGLLTPKPAWFKYVVDDVMKRYEKTLKDLSK